LWGHCPFQLQDIAFSYTLNQGKSNVAGDFDLMEDKANREYKDSVFVALCEDKKRLIEIYNAVSNKNYPQDASVKIVTLKDVLFLGRRNDVSFLMEDKLVVLLEHQSTVCENMPVRLLIYLSDIYEKLLSANEKVKRAVYGSTRLKIPKPELYVIYNGKANFPERRDLKLSDAFWENSEIEKEGASKWSGGLLELIPKFPRKLYQQRWGNTE
jgi:hypothetical protein